MVERRAPGQSRRRIHAVRVRGDRPPPGGRERSGRSSRQRTLRGRDPRYTDDWFDFGGIQRSVELVPVPETSVRNYRVETALADGQVELGITAWVDGPAPNGAVSVRFPELDRDAALSADGDGRYTADLSLDADALALESDLATTLHGRTHLRSGCHRRPGRLSGRAGPRRRHAPERRPDLASRHLASRGIGRERARP